MSNQVTDTLLMVRPTDFHQNKQTVVNNYFQKEGDLDTSFNAVKEFDLFTGKLKEHLIGLEIVQDSKCTKSPDSIFPNNWFSTHSNGDFILYPMYAENRRLERRKELVEVIMKKYGFSNLVDYSPFEKQNMYLESTGSMILDRCNKLAYASISDRTSEELLDKFCGEHGYEKVAFVANQTINSSRRSIYHTNVMLSIGEDFALLCDESIDNSRELREVLDSFRSTNKQIIKITEKQIYGFAANILQVKNIRDERYIVMSTRAYKTLRDSQLKLLKEHGKIIHSDISNIEHVGGGGVRCMMAEIFKPTN